MVAEFDSNSDHVRIFGAVIGHLEAEIEFLIFHNFDRSCRYNRPVQYGRDTAHKSRAAWAFRSLEVYMYERQHYLRVSERKLFSQTWRKSAVGDSAEHK